MFETLGTLGTIGIAVFILGLLFVFKGWLKSIVRMLLGFLVSLFGIAIGMINYSPAIAVSLFVACVILFAIGCMCRDWICDVPQSTSEEKK